MDTFFWYFGWFFLWLVVVDVLTEGGDDEGE